MKKRYLFVSRGFYWDWWEDLNSGEIFSFTMGEDPNEYSIKD